MWGERGVFNPVPWESCCVLLQAAPEALPLLPGSVSHRSHALCAGDWFIPYLGTFGVRL